MPARRCSMRKAREILRLRWGLGLSQRKVAESCRISQSTVSDYCSRAQAAGLSWPLPKALDDEALDQKLFMARANRSAERPMPDCAMLYRELRKKGVTLQLLWQEYIEAHPEDGYSYAQFCNHYRRFKKELSPVMRQTHRAGEKLFIDFAGQSIEVVDADTGEVRTYPIFVAALGASNYTFALAVRGQDSRSWLSAHVRAFEFFGGVPEVLVPDNLKAGVTKPSFYDPDINRSYQELADHYSTVVIPTRVRKPRDKAKVENAVQQVERWVLAPLRKQTFFSLEEANVAIAAQLTWLNQRPFQKMEGSRKVLFETVDQPSLGPLPRNRFEIAEWKIDVGVNIDYHIVYDGHYYSVPYRLTNQRVNVRATLTTIECFDKKKNRVALHRRSLRQGGFSTDPAHRPKAHQRHAEWTPSRLIGWAETVGPQTAEVCRHILQSKPHPEQGYRQVLGIIRLKDRYDESRLEAAARRACQAGAKSYRSIASILKSGLEAQPLIEKSPETPLPTHDNLRGSTYYQRKDNEPWLPNNSSIN